MLKICVESVVSVVIGTQLVVTTYCGREGLKLTSVIGILLAIHLFLMLSLMFLQNYSTKTC